jgi:hypothetical protein
MIVLTTIIRTTILKSLTNLKIIYFCLLNLTILLILICALLNYKRGTTDKKT